MPGTTNNLSRRLIPQKAAFSSTHQKGRTMRAKEMLVLG